MAQAEYPALRALIGKKIDIGFNAKVINSYVIRELFQTGSEMPQRGKMYKGIVEYDNPNMAGAYPELMFDAQTLTDILTKGVAMNPAVGGMYFALAETDDDGNVKEKPKAQPQAPKKKPITKEEIIKINAKNINGWHKMANENNLMAFMMMFMREDGEITLGCTEGLGKHEVIRRLRYLADMLESNPVVEKT